MRYTSEKIHYSIQTIQKKESMLLGSCEVCL